MKVSCHTFYDIMLTIDSCKIHCADFMLTRYHTPQYHLPIPMTSWPVSVNVLLIMFLQKMWLDQEREGGRGLPGSHRPVVVLEHYIKLCTVLSTKTKM